MKKIKLYIMSIVAATGMLAVMAAPATVFAASAKDAVCEGAQFTSGAATCDTTTSETTVKGVVSLAIRILQMIVGIISVFTIIIAGLGYITSGGDSAKTKTAKDRILYAAVGLMVVVLAEVIVRFVLNRVSSVAGV
jgi:hypothetical protein